MSEHKSITHITVNYTVIVYDTMW